MGHEEALLELFPEALFLGFRELGLGGQVQGVGRRRRGVGHGGVIVSSGRSFVGRWGGVAEHTARGAVEARWSGVGVATARRAVEVRRQTAPANFHASPRACVGPADSALGPLARRDACRGTWAAPKGGGGGGSAGSVVAARTREAAELCLGRAIPATGTERSTGVGAGTQRTTVVGPSSVSAGRSLQPAPSAAPESAPEPNAPRSSSSAPSEPFGRPTRRSAASCASAAPAGTERRFPSHSPQRRPISEGRGLPPGGRRGPRSTRLRGVREGRARSEPRRGSSGPTF